VNAYVFRDAEDIIGCLLRNKERIAKEFEPCRDSLEEIARESVGGNTFRAFRHLPRKPSEVFRTWASRALADDKRLRYLNSQSDYDTRLQEFCSAFREHWQSQMGEVLGYGPSRKLPNLLLKEFLKWKDLTPDERGRLVGFLHVPLDTYGLAGIRNCVDDPAIPVGATMSFVVGATMYNQIQAAIRAVTDQAGVPAIYFDVLTWDMRSLDGSGST
jgi:hypothetical protein